MGNHGWSYREVLPYFIRSEANEAFADSPLHGHEGPIKVTQVRKPNPMVAAFMEAMRSLGFKRNDDFNGSDTEGYGPRQGNDFARSPRLHGRRLSAPRPLAQQSPGLTEALVTRVVIENGRAIGVDVEIEGDKRRLTAKREVIVCAGAVQTPQVLMLSGIGDGEQLRTHGIPVTHHLPGVGANYHDHLAAGVVMEMKNSESYGISLRATPRNAWHLLEYALARRGPLASNVFEANAFLKSRPELDRPDLQIVFQPRGAIAMRFPFRSGTVSRERRARLPEEPRQQSRSQVPIRAARP